MKNKKNALLILIFCLNLTAIYAQKNRVKKEDIDVKVDVNLETFAIVERFAYPYSKYLYVRDSLLKIQEPMRPMVYYAYERYKNEDNSKIAKHMAAIIDTIYGTRVAGQDLIFGALIYAKPFPEKGSIAPFRFSHANLNKATIDFINSEIALLIEELRQFYIERKVGQFMKKHKAYYKGAVNEIRTKIPKGIVPFMTTYYRDKSSNQYSIFLIPSRAFSKGEWQANGPQIPLPNGRKHIIQLLSSTYLEVPIASNGVYTKFGFGDEEWLQDITIHEFGHTFCQFDSIIVAKTNTSATLFSGDWVNEMGKQGYRAWDVCVNEHVVRLGEIRIAEKMGDKDRAYRLRDSYIKNKQFVFIPLLEKKIVEYENNPSKYPTFKAFLPELLSVFDTITIEERDKLLAELKK
jgi:Domain of unknown function (DUF4932)